VPLDISVKKKDNYSVILIEGDIDLYSSPDVRTVLLNLVKKKTKQLYVDLEKVRYMDSSGVATFIECLQMVNRYQGKFALLSLKENVREVFKLTRLDKIFDIYENMNDALEKTNS
jgi:anti-sigma B factor antagonist